MKLNQSVQCDGYEPIGKDGVLFMLSGTTIAAAAAIEPPYIVYQDDGETVAADFTGMECTGVYLFGDSGSVQLRAARELETKAAEAIHAVEQNVAVLSGTVSTVSAKADTAQTAAETASSTAQEAKEIAEQAGTEPSVKAAIAMYVNATPITARQLSDVRDLIEDFVQGAEYEKGWVRRHDGKYYRMAKDIDSTTSKTYLPGPGMESLYTLIDLAPDGVRIWHQPTDATNSFAKGERAHYPDADGPIYISQRDGNTSTPGTDQWWTLETE